MHILWKRKKSAKLILQNEVEYMEIIRREFVYLWYYFTVQFEQIFIWWILGMVIGSAVSVFAKDRIHQAFRSLQNKEIGVLGIVAASALGIASPLCMYGTIPIAASFSRIPVINAGDGGHQHPTQTLTDLMTIRSLKGRLNGLTVGLCGDLKFGRTVHSLINALSRYDNIRFIFISPEELRVPDYVIEMLKEKGIPYEEVIRLEESLPQLDLLYMTRVQRERFFNEEDYVRLKDFYILDKAKLSLAPADMLVLHPLPRVNEISVDVDDDPRAVYFKQAQYGVYVRMALILTLLGLADRKQ